MNLFSSRNNMEKKLRRQLAELEYTPSGSVWSRIESGVKGGFERKMEEKFTQYPVKNNPESWEKLEASLPSEPKNRVNLRNFTYLITALAIFSLIYLNTPVNEPPVSTSHSETTTGTQALPQREQQADATTLKRVSGNKAIRLKSRIHEKQPAKQPAVRHNLNTTAAETQPIQKIAAEQAIPLIATVSNPETGNGTGSHAGLLAASALPDASAGASTLLQPQASAQQEPVKTAPSADEPSSLKKNAQQGIFTDSVQVLAKLPAPLAVADSAHHIQALQPNQLQSGGFEDPDKLTRYSIRVVAGAYSCFNRLEIPASANRDFTKNVALRNMLETPQIDWSGQFLVDYRLNDRWNLSAGIGILNFNQSFYFNTAVPSAINPTGIEKGAHIIYPNDSIVDGNNFSTRIKYSWTEFPVMIRYKLTQHPRFNIELETGVSYAVISTIDAGMVSYDNVGVLLIRDQKAFPEIKNSFFATFAPAITYQLNNETTIGLLPSAKFSLNSMIGNADWVQQYPYFVGLNASLTKRF